MYSVIGYGLLHIQIQVNIKKALQTWNAIISNNNYSFNHFDSSKILITFAYIKDFRFGKSKKGKVMENKKNRFLAAIEKIQKDKRNYLAAVKAGKTVIQMEKEGLKFLNVSR